MSLQTDRIFYAALAANTTVTTAVDGRIYNTSIALPDEDLDTIPCPYIIVTFDGMNNLDETKDNRYEGDEDRVNIGIEVTHVTRDDLAELVEQIREAIPAYFEGPVETELEELVPIDYTLSAGGVSYDPDKPCYFIKLNYACDTNK